MTSLTGIVLLSFREMWAKKVVIGLFVVSTLVLLMTAFALNLDVVEGSLAGIRLFGADVVQSGGDGSGEDPSLTLQNVVFSVQAVVAGAAYWIGILLALFSTAPLFTSMLEPGHVDLLLAKPLGRMQLFLGHIAGVALTMLILATYLLGGVWLIMSIKTGVWNPSFLLSIGILLAMFAVMYSVIVFTGVWTHSTALALIVTYGLIFISLFLAGGEQLASQLQPGWRSVFWGFYHVLPNFAEVTQTVSRLSRAESIDSWYPFLSSSAFGLVLYGGAATWFARRDF
jgi:ABC-type transport system involved in multi-copper enzyme maturation permease subunit